ncbi:translin-associated protein X [Quillaja saponaria]|uniref:Translin-associated protein X n=1 Tax=Quillaja saponaria TaxID=32244 RepID=A0AAD7LAV8_QUISA|nr:translin-associated protein X [Quillaja saponaria]KAJ7953951.1 translin-associated protein X [Quillaja saponaria]
MTLMTNRKGRIKQVVKSPRIAKMSYLHRMSKFNKEEVLEKAENDLAAVKDQYISRLVKELQGSEFWKLRRAYSPRMQEYINVLDYLSGLADLTGELMRLAIGPISDGELEFTKKICIFARDIYRELTLVVPLMDDSSDMKSEMDTMLQSVMKIENACFSEHVRGSEYMPLTRSNDPGSFLVGVPEIEL